MKSVRYLFLITCGLFLGLLIQGQENILQHNIHYSAYDQNMWGPDDSYDIDVEHTFFDLTIDENWGFTEITEIFGEEFGVGFQTGIFAYLRSTFEAHGFNTGSFDLDYPVEITLDFPNDYAFNFGGPATIHTSYVVTDGWDLSTSFPPVGVTTLDLEYEFNPFMDLIFCVFGCDTVNLIPSDIQVPHTLDTLFHINGETGYTVYPCFEGGDFQFCHDYNLPIEIEDWFDIGMTAFVTLPYVETEDYIQPGTNCLIASGDSLYMNVNIDVIHFLHSVAGLIPPPEGETIQDAIEFLADTISYPIETPLGDINAFIAYELLGVDFDVFNYMHQDIEFCPTIWANLSFPLEMPYQITDPVNGDFLYEEGFGDTIAVPVGHDLTITYPCHDWDSMYVGIEYDISPTIRNHTWDSIAFVISIDALTVSIGIETPFKQAIEPATMPSFTLPPVESQNQGLISYSSPQILSPGVSLENSDDNNNDEAKDIGPWEIGPLFSWEIPIGHADLTWFDETWEMENFIQDTVFPGTYIKPYDKSELQLNLYSQVGSFCYGDTANYIYGQITDSLAPATYLWSTGDIHEGIMNSMDSLFVEPGFYSLTVTDENGCTADDEISIQINPPILNSLEVVDVLCHGENTGTITATTSGGQYPFTYDWSNLYVQDGMNHNVADEIPAGMHYVTITDWMGCILTDSAYISEPPTTLSINAISNSTSCFGDDDGSIDITINGAIPPYNVTWEDGFSGTHVENLEGGYYTVSVTDQNDCLLTEDIEVIQPDSLVTLASSRMVTCYNFDNGIISLHPYGGTPPYNFQWFHDYNETQDSINNLPPGLFFCSVTDANGCQDTISQYITQPDSLGLNINTNDPSCQGLYDGWLSVNAFGGSLPYTYEWEDYATNIDSIPYLPAGTYTLTLTDANSCEVIAPIVLNEPDLLTVSFTNVQHVSCFGLEDGALVANVNGGTEPYTYIWDAGTPHEDSLAFNLDANMDYTVEIYDAHGCHTPPQSITITEPDKLILSGTVQDVECGVNAGSGQLEAIGGTMPFSFIWSNGESQANAVYLPAGPVSATVTDAHDCADSINFTISHGGKINAETVIIQEPLCFTDSNAVACVSLPNGTAPFSFIWYDEEGEIFMTGDTINNLSGGSYSILASDAYNCTDSITIEISRPDSINAEFTITNPSCSFVEDGEIQVDVTGGTSPYYYSWSTGGLNESISNITSGYYSLCVTDAHNCTSTFTIELMESEFCVIVHNTITPNGDGKNDVWVIENIEEFPMSEIQIFNRNGRKVFHQNGYANDWNGTFNNNDLPEGTYYYLIDLGTGKDLLKGYLTIIR